MQNHQETRSINQLLGIKDDQKGSDESYLVKRCTELSKLPISQFQVEDFRILISQEIALKYLMPPAINLLSADFFAEGDFYEGDLLKSVLSVNPSFWKDNPLLQQRLKQICLQNFDSIRNFNSTAEIRKSLYASVQDFLALG